MTGKEQQQFSFEIVSCLLAALSESGATVGAKHYKVMAQIDGTKTASGYEHMFRAVKARAKEINEQIGNGTIESGTPGKKNGGGKATPTSGRKRGRKAAKEETENGDGDDDEEMKETPSKKAKTQVKEEKSEEDDDDDGLDEI